MLTFLLWTIVCCNLLLSHCCVDVRRESCPPPGVKCRCQRDKEDVVVCCDIMSSFQLKEGLNCAHVRQNATKVHIFNATVHTFNADIDDWATLESLSVIGGQINKINGQFSGNLACVNFSQNNISEISTSAFKNLPKLKILDLSKNNVSNIPNITSTKHNLRLDISNNPYMWCNSILELMVRFQNTSRLEFQNRNDTNCLSVRSFHWFNSTDAMTLSQLELLTKGITTDIFKHTMYDMSYSYSQEVSYNHSDPGRGPITFIGEIGMFTDFSQNDCTLRLDEDCPKQCTCRTYRTDFTPMHPLSVKLNVNCSNQHLTELPPLPPNTIYLDVSNNEIKSLKPLCVNDSYSEVREFIADNNRIESISVLEGSTFIDNFAILSLRNNRIRSIPTYILSNAFDRTFHESRIVKIGGNKLQCNCSTSQVKMWLLNNKNYIEDHEEVLCDKAFERVIDIDPSKICIHEKDWTDYIYYIIAAEIFLLVSLISKVVYDYWVFKSFGYLPWPASRMPKLPCDWCFET